MLWEDTRESITSRSICVFQKNRIMIHMKESADNHNIYVMHHGM